MHGGGWHMAMRSGDEKPKVTRELLLRVLAYAKPYWWQIGWMLVTILGSSALSAVSPLIFRQLIDNILPSKDLNKLVMFALEWRLTLGSVFVLPLFYLIAHIFIGLSFFIVIA